MWISEERLTAIEKKLEELERRQRETAESVSSSSAFTVYKNYGAYMPSFSYMEKERISVQTVVSRILDRLGMKLEYKGGTPAAVEVVDAPKPTKRKLQR